jgi:N-acetylmuramoyl-L-alanine amidase
MRPPAADLARSRPRLLGAVAVAAALTLLPAGVALAAPAAAATHRPAAVAAARPALVTAVPAGRARSLRLRSPAMRGEDVKALQRRLIALHYDMSRTVTGVFTAETHHAVVAFQKQNGLGRDGVVGPRTRAKLARPSRPRPRSPRSGYYVEINKAKQLLYLFHGSRVAKIAGVSTGSGRRYQQDGATHVARTPEGRFRIQRQINGWRKSKLGLLYRPKYFYGGYAIHGSYSVPPYPVSHGCVRVTIRAMDRLWRLLPVGRRVFVYRR